MGSIVIGTCYILISVVAVGMELTPRIYTGSVLTKIGLAVVAFASLIQADKFI